MSKQSITELCRQYLSTDLGASARL